MKSILKKHGNESCRNYYTYHVLKVRLYNGSCFAFFEFSERKNISLLKNLFTPLLLQGTFSNQTLMLSDSFQCTNYTIPNLRGQ